MRFFLSKYKFQFLIILIFIIAEVLVNPIGEFPLNDDWSYTKTLKILVDEGRLYIGHWCAMTLVSHVIWGYLFVKVFGFSFTVLRLANLLSALIGTLVLFQISYNKSKSQHVALMAALVLLFNPIFFNVSNTFMTDTNFVTWLLVSVYFAFEFFKKHNLFYLVMFMLMSIVLILCRQFGIIVPFSFLLTCLFMKQKRWYYFSISLVGFLIVIVVFKYYESFLASVLPHYANYKFSNKTIYDSNMLFDVWNRLNNQFRSNVVFILFYMAPLCLFVFIKNIKLLNWKQIVLIFIWTFIMIDKWVENETILKGNVLVNMSLGSEEFYENSTSWNKPEERHTYSYHFEAFVKPIQFLFLSVSFFTLFSSILLYFKNKNINKTGSINIHFVFICLLISSYYFILGFTDVSFDRYFIPLLVLLFILFSLLIKVHFVKPLYAIIPLLLFVYVSIAGTKDYLTINRVKWQAIKEIQTEKQVDISKINAGFEPCNWYNGNNWSWYVNYGDLEDFEYLVQYRKEPKFMFYKTFHFQRYFPIKKDSINLFVRETIKQNSNQ